MMIRIAFYSEFDSWEDWVARLSTLLPAIEFVDLMSDDAREGELQGPIVRRSSHLVDGEPPLAIAEALPLAEAVSVTARLVDTSDIDPSVDPFPRFASRGGLGELDAKL